MVTHSNGRKAFLWLFNFLSKGMGAAAPAQEHSYSGG